MGIYDYMNHFWFENENDPCSLSEGVLYFYLLYEANRQHWDTFQGQHPDAGGTAEYF